MLVVPSTDSGVCAEPSTSTVLLGDEVRSLPTSLMLADFNSRLNDLKEVSTQRAALSALRRSPYKQEYTGAWMVQGSNGVASDGA